MTKCLPKRIVLGLLSVVVVVAIVAIVMIFIFTFTDREKIFNGDDIYTKMCNNDREIYKYSQWEKYGYIDYVHYTDYLMALAKSGEITEETRADAEKIARKVDGNSGVVAEYVAKFKEHYEAQGYKVLYLDAKMLTPTKLALGGKQQYFAYKDAPIINRMFSYFGRLVNIDKRAVALFSK